MLLPFRFDNSSRSNGLNHIQEANCHILQVVVSIIFEFMLFLQYILFLSMKEVNSSIMSANINVMPSLPTMHDQKLMTLNWCKVDGHFHIRVVTVSLSLLPIMAANTLVMDYSEQITYQLPSLQDQTIVEAPLRLIFRLGQWLCRLLFCWYRLPMHWSHITASISLSNYLTYITKNPWCSVEDQFQVVVTLTLTILHIKVAKL